MGSHKVFSLGVVTLFQRIENGLMFGNRLPGALRFDEGGRTQNEHGLLKCVRRLHQETVFRGVEKREMKLPVQLVGFPAVSGLCEFIVESPQFGNLHLGGPTGCKPRRGSLKHRAHFVELHDFGIVERAYRRALPGKVSHEPIAFQLANGFPHRGTRDAQPFGKLVFA